MSALNPLLRHKVEADRAVVTVNQLLKRCVGGGTLRRFADLKHMLSRVLRSQLELLDRPGLDRADAGTRREFMFSGLIEVVNRRLNALTARHMNPGAVLEAVDRLVAGAFMVVLRLVDEDKGLGAELDAGQFRRNFTVG